MEMEALEANDVISAGVKANWKDKCWDKWLSENGAETNYTDYEKKFFGEYKPPSLEKAYQLARELKRREEAL
jgi:hypothetical protein